MKKKKSEETVIETKPVTELDNVAQKLNQIELVLKEILEILKRKHPSSTDIFGNK